MIDLNKLHPQHVEALLESNRALPDNVTKHIVTENNHFKFGLNSQPLYKNDDYDYNERAKHILKGILNAKKKLFNNKNNKTWLFKPKGASALMAAYDASAKAALKNEGEFTKAARNGRIDADKLKSVLKGNLGVYKDLDIAVLQSIELSYLREEPFPKVLGERMQELGIVNKKQVSLVSGVTQDYENSVKAEESKRMAEADAAHQAIIASCDAENERRFEEMWGIKRHKPNNTGNTPKTTQQQSPWEDFVTEYGGARKKKPHEQTHDDIDTDLDNSLHHQNSLDASRNAEEMQNMARLHHESMQRDSESEFERFIREYGQPQHKDRLREREIDEEHGFER